MERMSRWRQRARTVIRAALEEADQQGLTGRDRERFVSGRYPFGDRSMYPYRVWLNEFSVLVRGRKKPMDNRRERSRQKALEARRAFTKQAMLFETTGPD